VSSDVLLLIVGVVFIWSAWRFPKKMLNIRDRIAARGGNVEKFERARRGVILRSAPRLTGTFGIVLVIGGLLK
jgi:hypothetical protein